MKRKQVDRRHRRRPVHRVPGATYPSLAAYIDETGDTLEAIAARTETTASYLSRIMNGHCCPRPLLAARIEKYTGVPATSYMLAWLSRNGNRRRRLQRSA